MRYTTLRDTDSINRPDTARVCRLVGRVIALASDAAQAIGLTSLLEQGVIKLSRDTEHAAQRLLLAARAIEPNSLDVLH